VRLSLASLFARASKLELMSFHVDAPPTEAHTLGFQAQALFDSGIAPQLNLTTRSQHALPR
jgi:hypothetical protein